MRGGAGAQPAPPQPGASAAAISAVLGNDDPLREILVRLGFPTTLVHAALVAKRWLRHASDPAFLRRFRDRHPPALLGFYLREALFLRRRFVAVSQAPELATAIHRASIADESFIIRGCRNGRLLVCDWNIAVLEKVVLSPLHPTRGKIVVPPLPRGPNSRMRLFLPEQDDNGDAVAVELLKMGTKLQVLLLTLQSGVWVGHNSAVIFIRETVPDIGRILMPVCGRIYMLTGSRHILRLDMAAASSSVLQLPDRVRTDNFKLSRAEEGSGLILIHAEGYMLSIWGLAANSDDVNGSELVYDRIPVREACDRHDDVMVIAVPFKMVWPPTFPALREENNQEE
ncbi:hypothetical protein BAE44_0001960 [Dichanthelium oligosanthes]|uniref:F-box protein AT5G49610-like beta-propeller domain-containing protein n=1 Tax=Dichanthelium oligosanthes TaxID=888268 RepID=A0A1E5WI13_9POAL|nr:hypothetical protein BAE44_0001960 [Dichanthelium oligosanthes]